LKAWKEAIASRYGVLLLMLVSQYVLLAQNVDVIAFHDV
jgi:hypothetical protein